MSMSPVVIHRNRTTTLRVELGYDASGDTFDAQIRTKEDHTSTKLGDFSVSFETDGSDGVLLLTFDDSLTTSITHDKGFMDVRRISNGEPLSVMAEPLKVIFRGTITA